MECIPIINKLITSTHIECIKKPIAASNINTISKTFTRRIMWDFSNLSAICPALAENKKKGRIKMPGNKVANIAPSWEVNWAVWNTAMVIKAVLKTLSLSAPKNCVQKNGKNRLSRINSNWPLIVKSPHLFHYYILINHKQTRNYFLYMESIRYHVGLSLINTTFLFRKLSFWQVLNHCCSCIKISLRPLQKQDLAFAQARRSKLGY